MKHLFRIVSSIILAVAFIYVMTKTDSWFWIGVECVVALLLAGLIIHVDVMIEKAHEIEDEEMLI